MANYIGTTRTNKFRVTDESTYAELFRLLEAEDNIEDFTEEVGGVVYHGFGCFGDVMYLDPETEEYDLDKWIQMLQKILPEDEAFIITSAGHEKLRYVGGWVTVATRHSIDYMDTTIWAKTKAKELLGEEFDTQLST